MNRNYKNSRYIVWLYDINAREYSIINRYLPNEHFEIVDIANDHTKFFELKNKHILQKPDVVICDIESNINDKIIAVLYEANSGLAKVTTKKTNNIFENCFELSSEEVELEKNNKIIKQTKSELSMGKIINMCQMANIGKLQKITKIQAKEIYNSIQVNKQIQGGKTIETVSKEFLFKLANTLNNFIELKDNYTAGHCQRVANYAEALGQELGLNEEQLEDLILAANLHDIGKIALPDAVITKTTKLNDLEFNLMKKHVELGALLLPGDQLGYLNSIVRAHHEKYDGSGYPDGLKGNDIPLFAQILAITDSFDAMTSQRSYNQVKSAEEAFEDLKMHTKPYGVDGGLGLFYNPVLVDKFIKVIKNSKTTMDNLQAAKKLADVNSKKMLKQINLNEKNNSQFIKKEI